MANAPRKSGCTALWRTDGGPLAEADLAKLGLTARHASWATMGWDGRSRALVHEYVDAAASTIVVGEVEEPQALAARMDLHFPAPTGLIVARALERFGSETPAEVIGEWSIIQRRADGSVTAMTSAALRDPLLWAQRGPHWAIAPDIYALARLDWVDSNIDEVGLLGRVGRQNARRILARRTFLRGVQELGPGESLTISPHGDSAIARCDPLSPQPRVTGSYADLVAQADSMLATIMAERTVRHPRSAVLLSGGLDSSLLATFAAKAAQAKPICITSAAPPGSNFPDETRFAAMVAESLGLPLECIAPTESLNTYRPSEQIFLGANGPPLSNRHLLTETMQTAAVLAGATVLINGTFGEMTATARLPRSGPLHRLRPLAALIRDRFAAPQATEIGKHPFHVRIAPQRIASLASELGEAMAEPVMRAGRSFGDGLFGYMPGAGKALEHNNELYPGALRMDFPYRDLRLLRLFAGFPIKTLMAQGPDRPVVRSLLDGRIPDQVRLRRRGMPASPDHLPRLQRQAPSARERIAEFRRAGLDDWIDLAWLDLTLASVAANGPRTIAEANQVQLTAIFAEFMLWWRER